MTQRRTQSTQHELEDHGTNHGRPTVGRPRFPKSGTARLSTIGHTISPPWQGLRRFSRPEWPSRRISIASNRIGPAGRYRRRTTAPRSPYSGSSRLLLHGSHLRHNTNGLCLSVRPRRPALSLIQRLESSRRASTNNKTNGKTFPDIAAPSVATAGTAASSGA